VERGVRERLRAVAILDLVATAVAPPSLESPSFSAALDVPDRTEAEVSIFGTPRADGWHVTLRRRPAALQAAYYAASGAMPIVAYRLFERITGPKREPWLVKTVGLLTLAIAAVLAADAGGRDPQTRRLGISSALAYGAVDTWYAAIRRRISPVYLLDAVVEAGFAVAWLARGSRPTR
jgi:hypothetical protein